jgi:hypothetical protein
MSRYSFSQTEGAGRRVTVAQVPLRWTPGQPDAPIGANTPAARVVDYAPVQENTPARSGWGATAGDLHFFVGRDQPVAAGGVDGWMTFGMRQGQNWLRFRISKLAIIHWPTRTELDIDADPQYATGLLPSAVQKPVQNTTLNVSTQVLWSDVFTTPGGTVSLEWNAYGDRLKEDIHITQGAREWLEVNRNVAWARTELELALSEPPGTRDTEPESNFYLGFVTEMDWSDIPRRLRDGVLLADDADFEGDLPIFAQDNAQRRLFEVTPAKMRVNRIGFPRPLDPPMHGNRELYRQPLRTRHFEGFMHLGLDLTTLGTLEPGALIFDPQVNDAFTQDGYWGGDPVDAWSDEQPNYVTERTTFQDQLGVRADVSAESIPNGALCTSANLQLTYYSGSSTTTVIRVADDAVATALSTSRDPDGGLTQVGSDEAWEIPASGSPSSGDTGNMAAALQSLFGSAAWPGSENISCWVRGSDSGTAFIGADNNSMDIEFFWSDPTVTDSPTAGALTLTGIAPLTRTLLGIEQEGYRWRNDDGSEAAATWRQAQDTVDTVDKGEVIRMRTLINSSGDPGARQYKLFVRRQGQDERFEVGVE